MATKRSACGAPNATSSGIAAVCFIVECDEGYRDCDGDADCPVGLTCNARNGVCLAVRCDADGDCEGPYVCSSGLCSRPRCDAAPCPAPMTCDGDRCVEP